MKKYTSAELSGALGITPAALYGICKRHGIKYEVVKAEHGKLALYTEEQVRLIKPFANKRGHYKVQHEKKPLPVILAPAEEHPLVTDERCLDFNYWPDPMPVEFISCEEEV